MKKIRISIFAVVITLGVLCDNLYALSSPTLTVTTSGKTVTATWGSSDNPGGYILLLAPYPNAEKIYSVDMGSQKSITADLWDGAAFYIAIQSYSGSQISGYSNVEFFVIADSTDDSDDSSSNDNNSSGGTSIILNGDSITVNGAGATADGSIVTIASAGTYTISGTLTNGQVVVDSDDGDPVKLILSGASITNQTNAPIYVISAESTEITLADNTTSTITDGTLYTFEDPEEDEPDAAIFSKDDLIIDGNGSLIVNANYNDGIKSKDSLVISGGNITVSSVDDGIIGKDYIDVKGGNLVIKAQGDGLKSTNDSDTTKGYVTIEGGVLNITSGSDGIQGETSVNIISGEINIYAGGGSTALLADSEASAKGIKASSAITVTNGFLTINSADDAFNSNDSIVVNGGSFVISTGDDGFHADSTLEINGGDINILESYEGIESAVITINDGDIHIVASDDGINVAGGNDNSGEFVQPDFMNQTTAVTTTATLTDPATITTVNQPTNPGGGGTQVWPGQDNFTDSGNYYLYINGGYIVVDAAGDGLDSNGSMEINGGVIIVNGPTDNNNGPLDYNGSCKITGGFLLAVGSSGMAQAPGTSSSQYSVLVNLKSANSAGTLINIQSASGESLVTFAPSKAYQSVLFSSPSLAGGGSYSLYYGGSSTGNVTDGLYSGGAYTPGTQYASFTLSSITTNVR